MFTVAGQSCALAGWGEYKNTKEKTPEWAPLPERNEKPTTFTKMVAPPRLELGTQGSSGLCSTN